MPVLLRDGEVADADVDPGGTVHGILPIVFAASSEEDTYCNNCENTDSLKDNVVISVHNLKF